MTAKNLLTPCISFLLFIFSCYSCTSGKATDPMLLRADSLMECCADSALALLEGIEQPYKSKEADRALYALLKTQADDKNYIAHTNDSLIRVAVNYYEKHDEENRKAEAYFYLGSVYRDMGMTAVATESFFKAKNVMQKNKRHDRLLSLIHNNLSELYEDQGFYADAMKESKKAYDNCVLRNDSSDMLYNLMDISRIHLYNNEKDSTLLYEKQALMIAEKSGNKILLPTILKNLAHTYELKNDLNFSNYYITQALNASISYPDSLSILYVKGKIQRKLGQEDSARICFEYSKNSENIYTQTSSHLALYRIGESNRDFDGCITAINTYLQLRDSMDGMEQRAAVTELKNNYETKIELQDLGYKQNKKLLILISISLLLLLVCISIFSIVYNRKKKQLIEQQKIIIQMQTKNLYAEITHTPTDDKEIAEAEEAKETLSAQIKRGLIVQTKLFKNSHEYKNMISLMANATDEDFRIPDADRENLKKAVLDSFCIVIKELREAYPITKADAEFCIFSFLGFSYKETAAFLNFSGTDACKVRKSRIKSKFNSEEMFAFIFTQHAEN